MDFEAAFAAFLIQDDHFSERLAPERPLLGIDQLVPAMAFHPVILVECLSDIAGRTIGISFQAPVHESAMTAFFEQFLLGRAFVDFETKQDCLVFDVPVAGMEYAVHLGCSEGL